MKRWRDVHTWLLVNHPHLARSWCLWAVPFWTVVGVGVGVGAFLWPLDPAHLQDCPEVVFLWVAALVLVVGRAALRRYTEAVRPGPGAGRPRWFEPVDELLSCVVSGLPAAAFLLGSHASLVRHSAGVDEVELAARTTLTLARLADCPELRWPSVEATTASIRACVGTTAQGRGRIQTLADCLPGSWRELCVDASWSFEPTEAMLDTLVQAIPKPITEWCDGSECLSYGDLEYTVQRNLRILADHETYWPVHRTTWKSVHTGATSDSEPLPDLFFLVLLGSGILVVASRTFAMAPRWRPGLRVPSVIGGVVGGVVASWTIDTNETTPLFVVGAVGACSLVVVLRTLGRGRAVGMLAVTAASTLYPVSLVAAFFLPARVIGLGDGWGLLLGILLTTGLSLVLAHHLTERLLRLPTEK